MKEPPPSKISCPHCGKEVQYRSVKDIPSFPFCSERCRLIDLGMWLDEEHRISVPLEPKQTDKLTPGENGERKD